MRGTPRKPRAGSRSRERSASNAATTANASPAKEAKSMNGKRPHYEFGGPLGALVFMLASHAIVYYFYLSATFHKGAAVFPFKWEELESAKPTWKAAQMYLGFLAMQFAFAWFMPGPVVRGLPVASENNIRHEYICNAAWSWWVTLALLGGAHLSGVWSLSSIADNLGPMLTVAVIFANVLAVAIYTLTLYYQKQNRATGNHVYDFFMGIVLNPRVGRVDIKFWAEIRVSWMLLFLLTLSANVKFYETYGEVSPGLCLMTLAHFLYTNACMKGEECIPTTWDIAFENYGWMLDFWNLVGVPWVYAFNSYYLLANGKDTQLPPLHVAAVAVTLLGAYYVWDTSQSQRNRFRMMTNGSFVQRSTFPQLPWGTLPPNAKHLKTANGGTLLIDGWWAYARKIHYAADITMATCWGLSCGFSGALPFFYPTFFLIMILHRARRDDERCAAKYGADWVKYKQVVPYLLVPGVI